MKFGYIGDRYVYFMTANKVLIYPTLYSDLLVLLYSIHLF
jgi:hypothetical protein